MTIVLASLITVGVTRFHSFGESQGSAATRACLALSIIWMNAKPRSTRTCAILQFEYRVGKLSDHDYQHTKLDLQRELAGVMAEIDRVKAEIAAGNIPAPAPELVKTAAAHKSTAEICLPLVQSGI